SHHRENNRDAEICCLRGQRGRGRTDDQDVHWGSNEFSDDFVKAVARRPTNVDDDVLTDLVAETTELLEKRSLWVVCPRVAEAIVAGDANPRNALTFGTLPLLRAGTDWRGQNCSEASDEGATVHPSDLRLAGS